MYKPIAVIGDIHGCFAELKKLFEQISRVTDEIYSVGDLIDRGPVSRDVVQFCIDNGIKAVRGNHEDFLLNTVELHSLGNLYELRRSYAAWILDGGGSTMMSYIGDVKGDIGEFKEQISWCGHLDYFRNMPLVIETGNCIISHGGIVEGEPQEDVLWNRRKPSLLGKLQIIGHTPERRVKIVDSRYVNIDTGCVFGGKLSSVVIFPDRTIKIYYAK